MEERRQELTDAQQRRTDAQNEILKLRSQKTDLETERGREIQQSEFALNEARRQMNAAAEQLSQNTQVISPMDGRVLEVKISPGSVLAVGTPVIEIESEGTKLEAVVYIPAERGKQVRPGMQVHLEPSTVKREEFGMMLGSVVSISDFPVTPQGMAALLHNDSLVSRFSHDGAPYAATVAPEREYRLRMTIASLDLLRSRLRGHFDGVFERAGELSPPPGQATAEVALGQEGDDGQVHDLRLAEKDAGDVAAEALQQGGGIGVGGDAVDGSRLRREALGAVHAYLRPRNA